MGLHMPHTANGGIKVAANIEAIGVRVPVTVAIARGVVVTPSKTDNRSHVILIAVTAAAIVRRSHGTAAPAAPGGFGRNSH